MADGVLRASTKDDLTFVQSMTSFDLRAKYKFYGRGYEVRNSPCGISNLEMSGASAHNRTMELLLGCTELRIPDTLSD